MAETTQELLLASVAASGTAAPVFNVPIDTQLLQIEVSAQYATVSATASGIKATYSFSTNGTTYNASLQPALTVAPAATVIGTGTSVLRLGNDPFMLDANGGSPSNVKVNLTNLDGSNAATVSVRARALSHQP